MTGTADRYQVMPPLAEEEYQALKADIAERGVVVPVVLDADGNVIDGHHRIRAVGELRAEGRDVPDYPTMTRSDLETEADKLDESWRLNMQRRHLGYTEKRAAIAGKLKESPEWSDNRIARLLGVDHKTVRSVRTSLEARGGLPTVEKLVGADGKEYPRNRAVTVESGERASGGITRERAEGPLEWRHAATDQLTRQPVSGPVHGRRSDGYDILDGYAERGRREQEEKERLAAERGVATHAVWRIVRVGTMQYVVEYGDGERHTVDRSTLLGSRWKKCGCCEGYGVVEK